MEKKFILSILAIVIRALTYGQENITSARYKNEEGKLVYLTAMTVYQGDTIPYIKLPTVYIFKPLKFKNKREYVKYARLVRDVKRVYPI